MEENNNQQATVNTDEIKKETVDTVNQVKETIKNVNIKEDAKETKGFVVSLVKDPFGTIKSIVDDKTNKHFKIAIILIIAWMAIRLIDDLFDGVYSRNKLTFNWAFKQILSIVKFVIAPLLGVLVLSGITYVMNKDNKKSLTTTITAITTAQIPVIVSALVGLLTIFSSSAYKITSPFSSLCGVLTTVLEYFAIKSLFNEEGNSKFFKKFVIIEAIYYVAYLIISFLEIYI